MLSSTVAALHCPLCCSEDMLFLLYQSRAVQDWDALSAGEKEGRELTENHVKVNCKCIYRLFMCLKKKKLPSELHHEYCTRFLCGHSWGILGGVTEM